MRGKIIQPDSRGRVSLARYGGKPDTTYMAEADEYGRITLTPVTIVPTRLEEELDPYPWETSTGTRGSRHMRKYADALRFNPRPEYVQDREAYGDQGKEDK